MGKNKFTAHTKNITHHPGAACPRAARPQPEPHQMQPQNRGLVEGLIRCQMFLSNQLSCLCRFPGRVLCHYWNAEYSNCGKPSRCYVWAARTSQATPRKTAFSFRLCKGYGWGHAIGISWKFCRLRYLAV